MSSFLRTRAEITGSIAVWGSTCWASSLGGDSWHSWEGCGEGEGLDVKRRILT